MKSSELVKKTDADLRKELALVRESLRVFRFGIAGSKSRNVCEGRTTRRSVSQYLTEINRRLSAQGDIRSTN